MLQFTLLGNAEIRQNGRIVSLPYRKAEALLYYMLMQRKAYRSELVELIWPDTEPSAALKNLRHAVYTIRKSLQCDFFLTAQRAVLELNPDVPFHCDALLFQENGSPEEYRGEFLKNFTVPQAVPYEEWLTETRAQLHTLYLRHLLEAERLSFTQGDLEKAEQYGRTYLDEDPFDESAASILMQVCAAQKQFRRAVKVYQDLRQNLNRELGIPPMKETTSLYYRIMNQWNSSTVQPEETPDSLLVGKSPALRKLLNVCRNRGRLSCFLLEGEPGVGKTRLVDHLLEKYDFADRITCRSFCFQTESNVPLSPWNEIMLTLSQEIRERGLDVDSISLSLASGLFPCLLSAWGWKAGSMDLNSNLPLREPYKTARDSTLSILSGVARSVPLLLIFEDLHWMDKSSVRLLGLLMRQLRNRDIILLLTSREVRPDYVEQLIRDATRDSIMERCELTRFTLEETAQFVSAYLGREQPEDLIEQMHQNTGGNALLLLQLISSIQESGDPGNLPRDMESIIRYRINNLPQEERQVLDLISVFHEWVEFETLVSVMPRNTMEMPYLCGRLKQRMLIAESERDGVLCYTLNHECIRSVLLREQSKSVRRVLHLRVARCLEEQMQRSGSCNYARLIYHFEAGGDRERTFQYKVLNLNAYTGMCYALLPTLNSPDEQLQPQEEENLLDHFHTLERELTSLKRMGSTQLPLEHLEQILLHAKSRYCIYNGIYEEGLSTLEQLLAVCRNVRNRNMELQAHLQYVFYGIQIYDTDVMERHLKTCYDILEEQKPCGDLCICLRLSGLAQIMRGQYDRARDLLRESIRLCEQLSQAGEDRYTLNIAGCYNYLGECSRMEGKYEDAYDCYDRAIVYNRSQGLFPGTAVFFTSYGTAAFQAGERAEAEKLFRFALEIYEESHEYSGYPVALSYLARYDVEHGRMAEAAKKMQEALQVSDRLRAPWWKGIAIYNLYQIRKQLQKSGRSVAALEKLWPETELNHCLWCLDNLRRLPPIQERLEMEEELQRLGER